VPELVLESIQHFQPAALRSPAPMLASAGEPRPVEAVYKDEPPRACHSLLGDFYLTSEWSGREKAGRIGFFVPQMRWGIECVRDGDKLWALSRRQKIPSMDKLWSNDRVYSYRLPPKPVERNHKVCYWRRQIITTNKRNCDQGYSYVWAIQTSLIM
jgi:hypothetical protein